MTDGRHVLHVTTGLGAGGAERTLVEVVNGTTPLLRHSVISLTSDLALRGELPPAVPVESLHLARGAAGLVVAPWALARLRATVAAAKPDVLQGWMYHGNLAASVAGTRSPVYWGVHHSSPRSSIDGAQLHALVRLSGFLAKRAAGIVYCAASVAAQHEELGWPASATAIIENGVDTDRYTRSTEQSRRIRHELCIPEEGFVVGTVGRNHPAKNLGGLVRAFARLASHHPDAFLVLVGPGATMDMLLTNDPAVRGRVRTLGSRPDVPALLSAMDVFALPSLTEALPLALLEAMSAGLPCVASDVGDCARVLSGIGRIVTPGDDRALADALLDLASRTKGERRDMGEALRNRVTSHYDHMAMAHAYASLWMSGL